MSTPPPGWKPPVLVAAVAAPAAAAPTGPGLATLRRESRRGLDGRRVVARIVDWLIVAPVAAIAAWEWGWHIGTYALFQCLLLIYHHIGEVTAGATPGKRLVGLRVADLETGGLPRPRQAAARGVIGIIEFGLIAMIAIVCNRGRRRLGDLAAGTAVVDARVHPAEPRGLWSGALVYPAVWLVPTLVALVLGARGEVPGSYRWEAERICTAAARIAPAGGTSPGYALAVLHEEQRSVAALPAPAAWRGARDELLRRLRVRELYLVQALPSGTSPVVTEQLGALQARDAVALRALGYDACAR